MNIRQLLKFLISTSTPTPSSALSISPMGEFYAVANASSDNDYGIFLQLNF